jgi:hypothetical protein
MITTENHKQWLTTASAADIKLRRTKFGAVSVETGHSATCESVRAMSALAPIVLQNIH